MSRRDKARYVYGTPLYLVAAAGFFHLLGVPWASIVEFAIVTVAALGVFALLFLTVLVAIEGVVSLSERRPR